MGLKDFDIIVGSDGDYVATGGRLVKIVNTRKSPNWKTGKSGVWHEVELADGQKLRVETVVGMERKGLR